MKIQKINNQIREKIKHIVDKYPSIDLAKIVEGGDAPTPTGDEIEIVLAPHNFEEWEKDLNKNRTLYVKQCKEIYYAINEIFDNFMQHDITEENSFAFIYIIL